MNFTFNMGNMDYTHVIIEHCKKQSSCDDCIVMKNGMMQVATELGQYVRLSCSTAIIRNMQNGNSKM